MAVLNPPGGRQDLFNALSTAHAYGYQHYSGTEVDFIRHTKTSTPDIVGMAVCDREGHVYELGDTRVDTTMQSMSKVWIFGTACLEHGVDFMDEKIAVEATDEPYNTTKLLDAAGKKRAHNASVNQGAITAMSYVPGETAAEKAFHVINLMRRSAGEEPLERLEQVYQEINSAVYESEMQSLESNQKILCALQDAGLLANNSDQAAKETLTAYVLVCSWDVNTRQKAIMAATLANNGQNPVTNELVITDARTLSRLKETMEESGAYGESSTYKKEIGLPVKTGVNGGTIAISDGNGDPEKVMGIATDCPLLNDQGNSSSGKIMLKKFVEEFALAGRPPLQKHDPNLTSGAEQDYETCIRAWSNHSARAMRSLALLERHNRFMNSFNALPRHVQQQTFIILGEQEIEFHWQEANSERPGPRSFAVSYSQP